MICLSIGVQCLCVMSYGEESTMVSCVCITARKQGDKILKIGRRA